MGIAPLTMTVPEINFDIELNLVRAVMVTNLG